MSRPHRNATPGIHHIGAHSVWTSVLFRDDLDRVAFLVDLAYICAKYRWKCLAFSLMTTHYHLLIETYDESLSAGMQELNFRHAVRFNKRHSLRGHCVDGRFWSERVESESHLLAAYRYIARNAIEAGLCSAAADYPWCSYQALFEAKDIFTFVDPSTVLGCWSPADTALEQLRRFVESAW